MIKLFKKIKRIIDTFDDRLQTLHSEINHVSMTSEGARNYAKESRDYIKSKTEVAADVHLMGQDRSQIIVVGRYNKRDYVEVFSVPDNELRTLIEQLREMQEYGVVRRLDTPPTMRSFIDNELRY